MIEILINRFSNMNITVYTSQDSIWTILSAIGTILAALAAIFLAWWGNRDKRTKLLSFSKYKFIDVGNSRYFRIEISNNSEIIKVKTQFIAFIFTNKPTTTSVQNDYSENQEIPPFESIPILFNLYNVIIDNGQKSSIILDSCTKIIEFIKNENSKLLKKPYFVLMTSIGKYKIEPSKKFIKEWKKALKENRKKVH